MNKRIHIYCYIIIALLFYAVIFFNYHRLRMNNPLINTEQYFQLSKSFLAGHLYYSPEFISNSPFQTWDMAKWNDKYYWPQGPFPAVLMMPFLFAAKLLGIDIDGQWPFNIALVAVIFWLCYKISLKIGFNHVDSLFWAIAFCFGSMFIAIALMPTSWFFGQTVTVVLLLAAIAEFLHKKRLWVIGTLFGLLALTRLTVSFGILFFALEIIFSKKDDGSKKLKKSAQLLIPLLVFWLILGLYDHARFDNFFEQGYSLNTNNLVDAALVKGREYGIFSLRHLPTNLYYAFISTPLPVFADRISHVFRFPFVRPDVWGMSVFITSLYLGYIFKFKPKDLNSKLLLLTIFIIALPVFLYAGVGYVQFGYRYALDFLPLVFLFFMQNYYAAYKELTPKFKILIISSVFLNLYLLMSVFYA